MLVLSEKSVILNGVTQASDLLCHFVFLLVHQCESNCDSIVFVILIKVELDRAGIYVPVVDTPLFREFFHHLERLALEIDNFRRDDKFLNLVAGNFCMGLKQSQDRNSSDSP